MGRDTLRKSYEAKDVHLTLKQKEFLFREVDNLNKRCNALVKRIEELEFKDFH